MKCSNCGAEINDNSQFCNRCGKRINRENNEPKIVVMKCNNCGGEMTVDQSRSILSCPYCGSKELILESDAVKIQKIKSKTYKDVALEKAEIERQKLKIEQEKVDQKNRSIAKEEAQLYRSGIISKAVAVLAIFILMLGIGSQENAKYGDYQTNMSFYWISILQVVLLTSSWAIGAFCTNMKIRKWWIPLMIIAICLIPVACQFVP